MRREWDDTLNPPSNVHSQGQRKKTGTQVKNMAQGAADVGKGAAQGAVSLARGAAAGAANIAQGAADAVKNTIGINNPNAASGNTIGISNPRGAGAGFGAGNATPNLMDSNIDVEGLTYPEDTNYAPSNRNTSI
ncbi:hypothetical protein PHJA_002114100 [Phtheirospermum japonicum]|uniref:Uncharacterized protein n=1 Tax=Phtheirospermum japonicum TaxID=374723 RepID=A0A830CIW9_9LAMI|nr:hypothetical protein PHJA_002114100 [Phtheirospermum japonicum]